jgi:zinc transport system permease protein
LITIFHYEFIQNAIYSSILASIACGIIGSLVIVNRMTFLAGGIAHANYGGVGLAFYLGLPFLPVATIFSIFISSLLALITFKERERVDALIGVMWAMGMALGIILIDITPGYKPDIMSFLFGSIITVTHFDLYIMFFLDIFILSFVLVYYRAIVLLSFDNEYAFTRGINTRLLYFLMLNMTGLSVVIVMRVVGIILVIALLTIPSYIAEKYSSSFFKMMILSILLCLSFCLIGIYISYSFDITSGAAIVAVGSITFLFSYIFKIVKSLKSRKL